MLFTMRARTEETAMRVKKGKKEAPKLNLYVWHNVLSDYTDGVAFALARSAKEARVLIGKRIPYSCLKELEARPKRYESSVGFAVFGGG
jgi:hypothetical protein